jgi:putative ABC transport system permease protein
MKYRDIILTANANLRKSKVRTLLTIIAVFIGAFTLSLTNGVGTGFSQYFNKQVANVGFSSSLLVTSKDTSSVPGSSVKEYSGSAQGRFGQTKMSTADLSKIKSVPGITEVQRTYNISAEYITKGQTKYVLSLTDYLDGLQQELLAGNSINSNDQDGIILTKPYVDALGFSSAQDAIGKPVFVAVKDPLGAIKEFKLTVRAVRSSALIEGGSLQASKEIVMQMNDYQSSGIPSLKDQFNVAVARYAPGTTTEQLNTIKQGLDKQGFSGKTIEEQIGSAANFIKVFQVALNSFGAIALVAATFGIVNTLLMAVQERTREIGLMKALGMGRSKIFALFSLEAILIGFWGSLFGVLASFGVGKLFNNVAAKSFLKDFEGLQMVFTAKSTITIMLIIMFIAFIAGSLPSRRAAKLDPIEALRYE